MRNFWLHWLALAIALAITTWLLPGVYINSYLSLAVAALVLGFVNAVVRPVLVLLTLPMTVVTLGLFYLLVNAAAFGLAALLVPGFTVAHTGWAILGAFVVGAVSWLIGVVFRR